MPFTKTGIGGVIIIEPKIFHDERGYFFESYNANQYQQNGINSKFVQDNEALSEYGVLRGLHYQIPPFAQAKLVRVISGSVLDVIVDIRPGSDTYGQTLSIEISGENKLQLFVPRGLAHGYLVLSKTAVFAYKCDNFYSKQHEGGIHYADPDLNIDWKVPSEKLIVSPKDEAQPFFKGIRSQK